MLYHIISNCIIIVDLPVACDETEESSAENSGTGNKIMNFFNIWCFIIFDL